MGFMKAANKSKTKKITLVVDDALLENAMTATGGGITETVEEGLKWLASRDAQRKLREFRGKVKFFRTWKEIKADR
jgi:hypothetical protein